MKVNANTPATPQARSDNAGTASNAHIRVPREAIPGAVQSQVQDQVDLATSEVTRAPPGYDFKDLGNDASRFFNTLGSKAQDFFSRVGAGEEQALTSLFNYTGNIGRAAVEARVDTLTRGAGARLGAANASAASRPAGTYLGNMTLARAFGGIGESVPAADNGPQFARAGATTAVHPGSPLRGAGSSSMAAGQLPQAEEIAQEELVGPRVQAPPIGVTNFAEQLTLVPSIRVGYRADDGYTNNYRGKGYEAIVLHGKATPSGRASYLQYQRGQQVIRASDDPAQPGELIQQFREMSNVSARQLVQKIRKNHGIDLVAPSRGGSGPDTPLYLLACNSTRGGTASSAAQGLANYTGREVRAHSNYVIAVPNPSALHGNPNYRVRVGDPDPGTTPPPGRFMPAGQRALLRARNVLAGKGPTLDLPHKRFFPQPGSRTEQDITRPTVAPPPSLASTSHASRAPSGGSPLSSLGSIPEQSSSYSGVQYYPPAMHPLVTLPGSRPQSATLGHSAASQASQDTQSSEHRLPGTGSPLSSSRSERPSEAGTAWSSEHGFRGAPSTPSSSTGSFTPSPADSPNPAYRRPGLKRATSS